VLAIAVKILLSSIACHPDWGSEAKVGWDAARAISQIPGVEECHVMTHGAGKEAIARAQSAGKAPNVRFHFYGKPFRYHPNRLLARLQSWLLYNDWQRGSLELAKRLNQNHQFSIAHHVTYASWRLPSRLWRLPIPFVLGPVGGGSAMLPEFKSMLSPSARMFEMIRDAMTVVSAKSRALQLCCTNASAVLAADSQTACFLTAHGATDVGTLCQVFFSKYQADQFQLQKKAKEANGTVLRIFAGGNLEARKGTAISLQALARLKRQGIPFKYTYGGGGPELHAMQKLAQDLGIAGDVFFHDGYAGAHYSRELSASDLFLLPSLRETAGITMMEAVLAGCYPIVLAGTGAGEIVSKTGGAAIEAKSPNEAIEKIASRIEWCHHNRSEALQAARDSAFKMRKLYSEDAYQAAIRDTYAEAIQRYHSRR
jgi:glycosyltransferase involved in cell wall biosynthesis